MRISYSDSMDSTTGVTTMDCNSRAVAHLQAGDINYCVLVIKNELVCVRAKLDAGRTTVSEGEVDDDLDSLMSENVDEDSAEIFSVPIAEQDTQAPTWESDGNLFSFYPRAFLMRGEQEDSRRLMVLMYNLALAHHVEAAALREQGNASYQQALGCALGLYKCALEVARCSWEEEDYEELNCLLLAIINNIGYISSHRMDFHESCHCIRMMCDRMILEATRQYYTPCMTDEDYELFFQSAVTYMEGSKLNIAPAA